MRVRPPARHAARHGLPGLAARLHAPPRSGAVLLHHLFWGGCGSLQLTAASRVPGPGSGSRSVLPGRPDEARSRGTELPRTRTSPGQLARPAGLARQELSPSPPSGALSASPQPLTWRHFLKSAALFAAALLHVWALPCGPRVVGGACRSPSPLPGAAHCALLCAGPGRARLLGVCPPPLDEAALITLCRAACSPTLSRFLQGWGWGVVIRHLGPSTPKPLRN